MVNGGWAGAPVKTPIPLERFPFKLTRTEWRRSGAAPADHNFRSKLIGNCSRGRPAMLFAIAFVLLILWVLGFTVFHVAGALIHVVLLIAAVVLVVGLFR